jgi:uncharacterized repeat protein (TIGR03943 family)
MPWLLAGAVVVIVLALTAIVRDVRRGGAVPHDGHHHGSSPLWFLVLPVVVLTFVSPPAIGANAATVAVREVSTEVLKRPYPPLPDGAAPEVSLPDVLIRAAQDTAGTLDGRTITVTGFTLRAGPTATLARIVIICCAADAQLARIALDGAAVREIAELPDDTWLTVQGQVSGEPPVMKVTRYTRVEAPANAYAY